MQARSLTRFSPLLVAGVVLIALFAPMIAIQSHAETLALPGKSAAGEVTVGIAVIVRATARRLLRSASTSVLRTTVGALGRTSARAATRRGIKFVTRVLFGSLVQQSAEEGRAHAHTLLSGAIAIGLGFVGLCLSFLGVLYVAGPEVSARITDSGLSTTAAVLLAGVPLLVYAGLHQSLGRLVGVRAHYRTEIDGLLLQGYFTGAGSFLPLTTDVEYEGSDEGKRLLALGSLAGMFAAHAVCVAVGRALALPGLEVLGAMFLVYCFLYSFPIRPLEGWYVWRSSKLHWALVALPVLLAFLYWLPPAFGAIL
jgi:hypothetical protein